MSNPEQDAAANVRKFLGGLKGLMALEPGLESLGSVKQAENEVRSRLTRLQADEQAAKDRIAAAEAEIAKLDAHAMDMAARTEAAAEQAARAAAEAAARVIADAKAEATAIAAAARTAAADLEATATARRRVLTGINTDIATAQKRLDDINSELAALRAKL